MQLQKCEFDLTRLLYCEYKKNILAVFKISDFAYHISKWNIL